VYNTQKKELTLERSISSSLCRFRIDDEHLITDTLVKAEISKAFSEKRCYEFYLDRDVVSRIKAGDPIEFHRERFFDMRNEIFSMISDGDQTQMTRLMSDTRLSYRLIFAIAHLHKAVAEGEFSSILDRRFVIVKELPGVPTLFYISKDTCVISHIGQGPEWKEIPTIYLGLKTFDALTAEQKKGKSDLFRAFQHLLTVEERAIETGYSHLGGYTPEVSRAINFLVEEVIAASTLFEVEEVPEPEKKEAVKKFTAANRNSILKDLNARDSHDEMNFDYDKCMKAVTALEKAAARYKASDDIVSLREVVRLLVSASGHDIHEVRDRANILLERVLAPKEFDSPLATRFINLKTGSLYKFEFTLPPENSDYRLRIYRNPAKHDLMLESDIDTVELKFKLNKKTGRHEAEYLFDSYGHFDFVMIKKKPGGFDWITEHGTSGRVNVIPDVRGEIILEIFVDIHGHARTWWKNSDGHPGLVYNENGEVIRLGRFSDIEAHLEDIKNRYCVSAIYLLGVQKRGSNYHDWAPGATSPSPFSPMSLVDIEPFLGGEDEFRSLIARAHSLDVKIIVDIIPHINRSSDHLGEEYVVKTYDGSGNLTSNASTDGRYGSWNDGKLLNYRRFEVWEWLAGSIETLIEKFDIDGIRFDSAHAVPVMMKRNNYPFVYNNKRSDEEMVEGTITVNDREFDHMMTTGYYDSACRDIIAVPIHYFLMMRIQKKLKEKNKNYFIHIAECFWGHERFLTRTGLIPYNASLFKICENIIHGKTDVREIYHIYDNYYPSVMAEGTELLGILGNHDERRALNTFGHRGLRAAVGITSFMSNIIMDYEGSAEGEGWKVYLDNIYVNWNQFEYAAHRSLDDYYRDIYKFHREAKGNGYLVWANNNILAASMKFCGDIIWLGIFNFAESNQSASVQFDNPRLPIDDNACFRVSDPLYSGITGHYSYYTGRELKISRLNTIVSFTERIKTLKFETVDPKEHYQSFLRDSFTRLCEMANVDEIHSNFSFMEISANIDTYERLTAFLKNKIIPLFWEDSRSILELGLKRAAFYIYKHGILSGPRIIEYGNKMSSCDDQLIRELGKSLLNHNRRGSLVFMSAEADPFSKSGGLANVVYELPRELARMHEDVYVITGFYKNGDEKSVKRMFDSVAKYDVKYSGKSVRFHIMNVEYEVGVHYGLVDGIHYYLLDHFEFFDGLYWGITSSEKLRRRVAFARAAAEVIIQFNLNPHYTFTNDAYTGLFNGIVKSDHYYMNNPNFSRNCFLHIVHNAGWQYFDAYHRMENGFDLFNLFNLPGWTVNGFLDPTAGDRLSCMAAGINHADRTITVSPSYAKQIEYQCDGLEHILRNVIGISNAIGQDFREKIEQRFRASGFVEETYPRLIDLLKREKVLGGKIKSRYPEILKGIEAAESIKDETRRKIVTRMRNKLMLQLQRGLNVDPDAVLFSFIHRISEQKGYQLLLDASEGIFRHLGYQGIIGGAVSSGDQQGESIARGLYLLGGYYPQQVNMSVGFQDVAIPLLCTDVFLMPSMHEPGGISQLEAFAAGCLVVARATGGLRDTVYPVRMQGDKVEGNGFLFTDYSPWSFYDAMERTHKFFKENDEMTVFMARENAEKSAYFWDRPARKYIEKIYGLTETIRILPD
jgi:starch synthase